MMLITSIMWLDRILPRIPVDIPFMFYWTEEEIPMVD